MVLGQICKEFRVNQTGGLPETEARFIISEYEIHLLRNILRLISSTFLPLELGIR